MKQKLSFIIAIATLIICVGSMCYAVGYDMAINDSFTYRSKSYLKDYKIDLPEEILEIQDEKSDQVEHLVAYKGNKSKTIYIWFAHPDDKFKNKIDLDPVNYLHRKLKKLQNYKKIITSHE